MATTHRGLHLIVDGLSRTPDISFSKENLTEMFHELVNKVGMKMILEPIFKEVEFDPDLMNSEVFKDEGRYIWFLYVAVPRIAAYIVGRNVKFFKWIFLVAVLLIQKLRLNILNQS